MLGEGKYIEIYFVECYTYKRIVIFSPAVKCQDREIKKIGTKVYFGQKKGSPT